ncbi:hypothetical protein KX928_23690 [Roseobacter sp. YSTF-M11]|uniref:Sulfotransferase family protein n=1 Tax=Roseobacter insulae TaxID=2859783 RepID=A0A9X1K101_9RHOB|nr:hypothetical protein [Roseobacter insulae]MBW4710805.1 hypothetical protein [Roseobacter insulae]
MDIVTGMHRSGTSFLSQALSRLGADFGPEELLFKADLWNQNGYFENIEVVDINNRMILGDRARIDYWLEAPESGVARALNSFAARKWKYFLFPPVPRINARATAYEAEITRLHDTYKDSFVKDPRFCLTLSSWLARGSVERLFFSFRNPAAVAGSLKQREGLPLAFGHRYWLYHIRGFIAQLPQDSDVSFVDFDAFFDAQTQRGAFERLAYLMGVPTGAPQFQDMVGAFDLRLRTQMASLEDSPAHVRHAYAALQALMAKSDGPVRVHAHPECVSAILGT